MPPAFASNLRRGSGSALRDNLCFRSSHLYHWRLSSNMPWQMIQNNWELRVLFPVGNNRSEIGAKKTTATGPVLGIFCLYGEGKTTKFIREREERPRGCRRTA